MPIDQLGRSPQEVRQTTEYTSEKGKLVERRGRKATGLTPIRVWQPGYRFCFGAKARYLKG
jgi:hypothetical protein